MNAKLLIRLIVVFVFVQAICIASAVAADDKVVAKPVVADTSEKIAQVTVAIRDEMKASGRYEFINAKDRSAVEADLDKMNGLLQKSGSVAAMSEDDKVQLFNTQEHLNGLLTHSDRNRLVCERRAPLGTNLKQTTCKTVAEIELARRDSQKTLQDARSIGSICTTRCSGD